MKKKILKTKNEKYQEALHKKNREWQDKYNTKESPYQFIALSDRDDSGMVWLNPNHQQHLNFGWITYSDVDDWLNDKFNEKIFLSKEHMEEIYFLCSIPEGTYLQYRYQHYTKIKPEYFDVSSHWKYTPEKVMDKSISDKTYKQILSFVKQNYARDIPDNVKINSDGTVDISHIERMRQRCDDEAWGIMHLAGMLGMGYYGYSNTPCEIENIVWVKDQLYYEALFEYYRENGVISEEQEQKYFKNNVSNRKK